MTLTVRLAVLLTAVVLSACDVGGDGATSTATGTPPPSPAVADCEARGFGGLAVGDVVEEPFVCIAAPLAGISVGGTVEVSGWSAGAFEASLILELLDGDDSILSRMPVTVAQPEIGLFAGEYSATLALEDAPRFERGRVHVWAQSPRDGSIAFEVSVDVVFGP